MAVDQAENLELGAIAAADSPASAWSSSRAAASAAAAELAGVLLVGLAGDQAESLELDAIVAAGSPASS